MRYRSLLYCFLFLVPFSVSAQYYETGQDPASLKWLQIKTNRFKVIYPENYGNNGEKFALALEKAYNDISFLYPDSRFRIPVIIHNHTTQSNGYVAYAPRRMEIYPTPEQNTIPLDPARQLALHELTHVLQMESLNKGFSKFMSIFFGQQFPGAMAALLPLWYLEGDAVFVESAFSGAGRGNSASFQKQLKALSVEKGKVYKYDKLVNGSFRDYVPDHYQSGSQAVTMARLKYGQTVWNKALKTTANIPFLIDPVNISLLENIGKTKKGLFRETFDTLNILWNEEIRNSGSHSYKYLNQDKGKKYLSYFSPVPAGENKIAAIRTSLSDPPVIVLIDTVNRSEKKIHVPGIIYPYYLSGAGFLLVWVENQPDPRWENRNYSVIKMIDIRSGSVKQLTWKTRLMSASISPDGKSIAAVENTVDNKNNLILFDLKTNKITASIPVPGNASLQRPQWSADRSEITAISLTEKGEGIISYKPENQTWKTYLEEGYDDLQSAFLRNDTLFYVSSASGVENIFILNPEKKSKRITNSQFGATDLMINGDNVFFCDYTSSGNNICSISLKNASWHNPDVKDRSTYLIEKIEPPEKNEMTPLMKQSLQPVRYRKWQHLFGFHSWMPLYADIEKLKSDPTAIKPGFTLLSQNNLSTVITSLGYEYSDKKHMFHSRIRWQGLYPVIESTLDYGDDNIVFRTKTGARLDDPELIKPELKFSNTLSIPLTFSTGKFYQFFQPSISANYRNQYILYIKDDTICDYGQTEMAARLYFANYHKVAARDIYPRFAHILDLNYSFHPFDKDIYGSFLTLRTALYFPGLFRNNGIRFRYEADRQYVSQISMWNRINYPRGYRNIASENLYFLSADYVTPLGYPDLNVISLLYLTRLRADLFYDYASGTGNYHFDYNDSGSLVFKEYIKKRETFSSFGVELLADFYVLRIPYMISAGIQASWQKGNSSPTIGWLFNIDIYGMNIGRYRQ